MDNPWATTSSPWLNDERDVTDTVWPTAWKPTDSTWDSDVPLEQDITTAHELPPLDALPTAASVSDHHSTLHPLNTGPEATSDDLEMTDDDWEAAWGTTPSVDPRPKEPQAPDQWEATHRAEERFNRAVPPELLESLLRHCQQVSEEIWPAPATRNEDDWKFSLEGLPDVAALVAQLVPADLALPPAVQFSATATAKAMNDALKLTRHLPASATSPLSRLLASKGCLEWETSIKAKQNITPDTVHAGWRVLDKDDHPTTLDESKPRKPTGGLLSFWNRRTSANQAAAAETSNERSVRSSLETTKSVPHPTSSRASSPSKTSISAMPPPPPPDSNPVAMAAAPAPSVVSRFLNRFSRARSAQHGALALSSDDFEFLSDIVPSASDPHDDAIDDGILGALTSTGNSTPLPPRLPPPPKPLSSSAIVGLGTLDGASVVGSTPATSQLQEYHTPTIPVLATPLSPKPAGVAGSFLHTPKNPPPLKGAATPTPLIPQRQQPSSQPNSRPQLSSPSLLPEKFTSLLSIPPLLPPPPVSPPVTPRPGAFPSVMTANHHSSAKRPVNAFNDSHSSDDEFSAFASFPARAPAPFPSLDSQQCLSPPSPPPRRTYERTHYPSSSSASSILSPESQTSVDQLCSAKSSISASFDSFDDFISSPPVARGEDKKRTPPPPPLPAKPQLQHQTPLYADTHSSSFHRPHTSKSSLLNNAFPLSVSNAEHQRTQSLVNQAAARGGFLWPNSPDSDESRLIPLPPPPSSLTSSKPSFGDEGIDLLDDNGTVDGDKEAWYASLNASGGDGVDSAREMGPLHAPLEVAGGPGMGLGLRNQLQPSPPPFPSASTPVLSFSSLGTPSTAINTAALQPQSKRSGGLSAQDLSFFEGL